MEYFIISNTNANNNNANANNNSNNRPESLKPEQMLFIHVMEHLAKPFVPLRGD